MRENVHETLELSVWMLGVWGCNYTGTPTAHTELYLTSPVPQSGLSLLPNVFKLITDCSRVSQLGRVTVGRPDYMHTRLRVVYAEPLPAILRTYLSRVKLSFMLFLINLRKIMRINFLWFRVILAAKSVFIFFPLHIVVSSDTGDIAHKRCSILSCSCQLTI